MINFGNQGEDICDLTWKKVMFIRNIGEALRVIGEVFREVCLSFHPSAVI